ncbi:MAG TPA: thymidine phosphorylase [Thermoleophilia bacterium]|nr:thymidine phosphorylase [Thermoleophilia bacterium]
MVRDIIAFKRDGGELDGEKLAAFGAGVVDGTIPAYQASALLMAIVLRGFSRAETIALAHAMVASGKTLDLSALRRPVLDKHSSGGVGDKVTLALAPLVAACGGVFGKMSGRGLGHTGGTLDKLESIPGFRVQLSQGEFLHQLERIGVAVTAQSERIVPADRILYALRDVTATVDNDGLIAASIMAKKIATGTSAIVLDLKVGRGAFMGDIEQARDLGELCAAIGASYGRPVTSFFTAMDAPLGMAVGNRLEVEEAWEVLTDGGPPDVRALVLTLAGALLALADLDLSEEEGRASAERALAQGAAAETFQRWCASQGGTWRTGDGHRLGAGEVRAPRGGYVTRIDALLVGRAAQAAGAGRRRVDDVLDHAAGVVLACRPGDRVEKGDLLARAYARDASRRQTASALLVEAFAVGEGAPAPGPLVLGRTATSASPSHES